MAKRRPIVRKRPKAPKKRAPQRKHALAKAKRNHGIESLKRELADAREQQQATAEVLRVISRSAFDLQLVLDTLVQSATRLCDATDGIVFLRRGELLHSLAHDGPISVDLPPQLAGRGWVTGRAVVDRLPVHVRDPLKSAKEFPDGHQMAVTLGFRTILSVPLMKESDAIGAITIRRTRVKAFTNRQIELVRTFADQAVIAIENVRLFNETREALERQTATAEILRMISSSPKDTQPVFDAIVQCGLRLFPDAAISIALPDGDQVKAVAVAEPNLVRAEGWRNRFPFPLTREYMHSVAILDARPVDIPDVLNAPAAMAAGAQNFLASGYRAITIMPMLRGNAAIGVLSVVRHAAGPLSDHQRAMLKTFADQAVIAIENTRLLNELRQRTDDLSEALTQQTATSDVLEVISRSQGDLEPVFEAMLAHATRNCGAELGVLFQAEGDEFRTVALYGAAPEFVEQRRKNPMLRPNPGTALGRVLETRQIVQIADVRAEPAYQNDPARRAGFLQLAGARTVVCVPMLKDSDVVGAISIYRQQVQPFTTKQVDMLANFAAQAIIAIENARLLNELRARTAELDEALHQQTATADVLKVISRSAFDLPRVLQTLLESAVKLAEADNGTIARQQDGAFYRAEAYGFSEEFLDAAKRLPIKAGRDSAASRALLEGRVVQIPDILADPDYTFSQTVGLASFRTALGVPMLRDGNPIGILALTRSEVRPFTDKQIELVSTFADQAAIAIENARLFEEVQARTRELAASLDELRAAQDRLVQTEKLASLGQLTAGIAHEIKNPLNFVNNFSALSVELIDELNDVLKPLALAEKARHDIDELTHTLKGNLEKVVQHGMRADSIVKNMLLHSRQGSGEQQPTDINTIVEESLNLAYHGARAERTGFDITLQRSLDPDAGAAELFPQEITRVLLNLISNGFYAATKRKEAGEEEFEPTLSATTKSLGERVEIRIRDNGVGIPQDLKEKIFNPFFTTKPAGEGTGLGLSMSHDIVVKQHGGRIDVDSTPGEFTEFTVTLPRTAAQLQTRGTR
jgi:GAF domain-containing protein/anti-sigma regulatory factor (Ser/Thr protein kinase)